MDNSANRKSNFQEKSSTVPLEKPTAYGYVLRGFENGSVGDFNENFYSTVTDFAKFLGLSISQPLSEAT